MESALSFSGTLSAPVLTGEFVLSDVEFFSNRFGVGFSNLNASILADNEGNAGFEGSVNSGQGELSFSGDVTELFSDGREVSGQVQGSDFAFIDLPDLKLELTPRLTVQASAQGIDLSGRVEVPRLHLTLRELPETAVNVSRDVTIVSYPADRPDLARSISASQSQLFDIPVTGEIQLVLGENVEFNGFGLAATFGGELQVQQTANGTNYSYGEVAVQDGVYQLYGQTLQIQQGTLLFLGALENPALDIRAVRVVGDQTVGVLMNGTLRNRHSQLFSSPVLPENDILAVMITGRPYSQLDAAGGAAVIDAIATLGLERGQGITGQIREQLGLDELSFRSTGNLDSTELSLGKYLTPEIFVKYGVGLFDHQTKITVDYWMSDRFKLQGESGEYQSVDLTYTVER